MNRLFLKIAHGFRHYNSPQIFDISFQSQLTFLPNLAEHSREGCWTITLNRNIFYVEWQLRPSVTLAPTYTHERKDLPLWAAPVKLPAKIWIQRLCRFLSLFLASWKVEFSYPLMWGKAGKSRISSWLSPYPQVAHFTPTLPAMTIYADLHFTNSVWRISLRGRRQETMRILSFPPPWADKQNWFLKEVLTIGCQIVQSGGGSGTSFRS